MYFKIFYNKNNFYLLKIYIKCQCRISIKFMEFLVY